MAQDRRCLRCGLPVPKRHVGECVEGNECQSDVGGYKVLDRKGFLVVKHERRLTAWLAIGGVKQPFYWVSGRILDGD